MHLDARLNLRLSTDDLDELRAAAEAHGETLSDRTRELILRGLANENHHQELAAQQLAPRG